MGNKIRRLGERLASITNEDVFEKVYNMPAIIRYIILGVITIVIGLLIYASQMANDPIAIESNFSKTNENYFNFTVNDQYTVGDDVYSIITYTSNDGWYTAQWNNKENSEFNKQKIENEISLDNPIAIGQIISYFEEEFGAIKSFEVIDKDSLVINGKKITADIYNTQVVEINIDNKEFEINKFHNILLKQYGQLDLLNRYKIDISKIAINNVDHNGTVEFIYSGKIWELSTMDNKSEKVNIKWNKL